MDDSCGVSFRIFANGENLSVITHFKDAVATKVAIDQHQIRLIRDAHAFCLRPEIHTSFTIFIPNVYGRSRQSELSSTSRSAGKPTSSRPASVRPSAEAALTVAAVSASCAVSPFSRTASAIATAVEKTGLEPGFRSVPTATAAPASI